MDIFNRIAPRKFSLIIELNETAKELREDSQSITEIFPNITKTLGFN